MVNRLQIRRTSTNNTPPADGSLLPGELAVEMGAPLRLWVGVPTSIVASGKKMLLDSTTMTPITSVNGKTGVVVLNSADVGALPTTGGNITGSLTVGSVAVSLSGHTHAIADVTGLQTALDGKAASSHTHTIANVTGLQTALDGKAATSHTHAIADVSGLQAALDAAGSSVSIGTTAPASPTAGKLWWNSETGSLKVYYNDGTTSQWVDASMLSLPDNSVTTAKLVDGNVTSAKIGAGAVLAAAIAVGAVAGDKIALGSDARGDIMYHNGTRWSRLPAGTTGKSLLTQGSTADPVWGDPAGLITPTTGSPLYYGARAWVNFNGTGTIAIRSSQNVSSITDVSVGLYGVNYTTAMPDTSYAVVATAAARGGGSSPTQNVSVGFGGNLTNLTAGTYSTSRTDLYVQNSSGSLVDVDTVCCAVFR